MTSTERKGGFRSRLHERIRRIRGRSQDLRDNARFDNRRPENGKKDATRVAEWVLPDLINANYANRLVARTHLHNDPTITL